MKVSKVVFGIGTSKDITIYEVLHSAKPRKISFNVILSKAVRRTALNLTLAHTHSHKKTKKKQKKKNKKKKQKKKNKKKKTTTKKKKKKKKKEQI